MMFKPLLALIAVCIMLFVAFSFFKDTPSSVRSPLAKAEVKAAFVKKENSWFPKKFENVNSELEKPEISAKGAVLVDYDTGDVLLSKYMFEKLPAASTVKIMTALLALENNNTSDVFSVSERASKIGEDSMGLSQGEKLTVEDLLFGLLLPSGNDAAVTIAENVSGSEDDFVALMNSRAKELGMRNTKFVNASGLDVDEEDQYSTAYDLAILAHYVWENLKSFRRITSTDHIFIDSTDTHKAFELYNDTNLLTTYPGVKGIKPGFTWEAGFCLVTYAENDGKRLIGVILNSGDRRGEMKELLDYGFGYYGIKIDHPALDF